LVPLVLSACFLLSCGSGFLWGLLVRTPDYPWAATVPLYPGAVAVVDRSGKIAGVSSPTPFTPGCTSAGLTDFQFMAASPPGDVVTYYKAELGERYGFQVSSVESTAPGVTVIRFVRDTGRSYLGPLYGPNGEFLGYRSGWAKEIVTITLNPEASGMTRVDGKLEQIFHQP
jgi:hypothetical protein